MYSISKKRNLGSDRSIHKDCHWLPNCLTFRGYNSHLQYCGLHPLLSRFQNSQSHGRVEAIFGDPQGDPVSLCRCLSREFCRFESSLWRGVVRLPVENNAGCFLPVSSPQPWKTDGLATLFPPSFANHQGKPCSSKWRRDSVLLSVLYHRQPSDDTSCLLFTSLWYLRGLPRWLLPRCWRLSVPHEDTMKLSFISTFWWDSERFNSLLSATKLLNGNAQVRLDFLCLPALHCHPCGTLPSKVKREFLSITEMAVVKGCD